MGIHFSRNYSNQKKDDNPQSGKKATENINFYNFPLPAGEQYCPTCFSQNLACTRICFALKSQNMYDFVSSAWGMNRKDNFNESRKPDFVNAVIDKIEQLQKRWKKPYRVYIRINSSGDFYSDEYLEKWIEIANYFFKDPGIHFMAYTKEIERLERVLNGRKLDDINIKFVYSIMEDFQSGDTPQASVKIYDRIVAQNSGSKNQLSSYTVHPKKTSLGPAHKTVCGLHKKTTTCVYCRMCYDKSPNEQKIHMLEF